MTAGAGCQHSEMFPLVSMDSANPLRLFQIWLNLPKRSKFAPPGFKMHWDENVVVLAGEDGKGATARLYTGRLGAADSGFEPPSDSWGAAADNDLMVAVVKLPAATAAGVATTFNLPPAARGRAANRVAYVVECGASGVSVAGVAIPGPRAVTLDASAPALLSNGDTAADALVLVLQGVPIGESVAQHGPFVMNTDAEISAAFRDYERTSFGGWPWRDSAPVFERTRGRFASYKQADGSVRTEEPPLRAAPLHAQTEGTEPSKAASGVGEVPAVASVAIEL